MPYIKKERRELIDPMQYIVKDIARTPGELNFQITRLIVGYTQLKLNYQVINDVLGALEGAKMEFYRRVAAPYEDTKIKENGDVY